MTDPLSQSEELERVRLQYRELADLVRGFSVDDDEAVAETAAWARAHLHPALSEPVQMNDGSVSEEDRCAWMRLAALKTTVAVSRRVFDGYFVVEVVNEVPRVATYVVSTNRILGEALCDAAAELGIAL